MTPQEDDTGTDGRTSRNLRDMPLHICESRNIRQSQSYEGIQDFVVTSRVYCNI